MKNPSDALIIGYRGDRIIEHVKSLESLREKGLVGKINVLASRISQDAPVSSSDYRTSVNYDSEIQRNHAEAGADNPAGFSKYRTDIKETISQTGSTLVLPTTDRAVIATAEVFNEENYKEIFTSNPDIPIVQMFQDKVATYSFFNRQNIFRTPTHRAIHSSNLDNMEEELLPKIAAPYFAKPACPQKGGSTGAEKVSTIKELSTLMNKNPQYADYLISEFLNGPEINHTIIVNPDGSIATQCTYEVVPGEKRQRVNIWNEELNEFGHKFGKELHKNFKMFKFRSVYNFDFLKNKSGELVLSEVNPGRFPSCMGVYNQGRFNALEPLLLAIEGISEEYPESYIVGKRFRN